MGIEEINEKVEQMNENENEQVIRSIYGDNQLDIPTPPFFRWMGRELTRPFHII